MEAFSEANSLETQTPLTCTQAKRTVLRRPHRKIAFTTLMLNLHNLESSVCENA